ncbi:helicase [Tessaracoccus sp. MC1756]|uniref:helicase n=1 Tax=Tessaracoccus sp. MC1756 TaxID=2760311 RepID=UPI0015FF9363|nr:helicase [Tessaracoccus sp. MC1756]MBB1510284.1 helicase [Tessaracoccus sp. MC1756]
MNRFDAEPVLKGLKEFQRDTVDHVFEQFYTHGSRHFLVADETGLGKSVVARGLIARTIARLQDDENIQQIDVVYVCSNADLARQNLKRLNVTGGSQHELASRLTMLALHAPPPGTEHFTAMGKRVNLIAFTPGTTFETGNQTGMADERAVILALLKRVRQFDEQDFHAAARLLRGQVSSVERFRANHADWIDRALVRRGVDDGILEPFEAGLKNSGLLNELDTFMDVARNGDLPAELRRRLPAFIGDLRTTLAHASLSALQPDLVILDEFQKFPHLLRTDTPAGELAAALFAQPDARVLLLSATPYKPFSLAEETEDAHERDLFATLGFLARGNPRADVERVRQLLRQYRVSIQSGSHDGATMTDLREELLKLMCRSERPSARPATEAATAAPEGAQSQQHAIDISTRITEVNKPAADITAEDLSGYVSLMGLAEAASTGRDRGLVTPTYWKSAPYFPTFCDGYKLRERIRERHELPEVTDALRRSQHITAGQLRSFQRIDPANARMRALEADTVGAGWWQLLWVPPTLPYLTPRGPFQKVRGMTKRLVFSSWTATPTAVASLLSNEAERRLANAVGIHENTPEQRKATTRPMAVSMREGEPGDMPTLAAMWPAPKLAEIGDPLRFLRATGGTAADPSALKRHVVQELATVLGQSDEPAGTDAMWRALFATDLAWPAEPWAVRRELMEGFRRLTSGSSHETVDEPAGLDDTAIGLHIKAAEGVRKDGAFTPDRKAIEALADLAISSPGSIAWRVVERLCTDGDVALLERLQAAAVLSNGIRSLFNRPEAALVLQAVLGGRKRGKHENKKRSSDSAWRRAVIYSGMGNLESVLDEWLFHKAADSPDVMDGTKLMGVARTAAHALSLSLVNYQGLDAEDPLRSLRFPARFALRYNNKRSDVTGGEARLGEVREAFNSPFWPFVLATTSVGQEGIDFHWWCHSVLHWNIPSNPVDFEQREGRVDRFRGHAIRRNIAQVHGATSLHDGGNPWVNIYVLAKDVRDQYGHFAPDWVYPGAHRVERHVSHYPLSTDEPLFNQLKRDLALYRLTFGQPRQEDMLALLQQRLGDVAPAELAKMRLDLSPPKSPAVGPGIP